MCVCVVCVCVVCVCVCGVRVCACACVRCTEAIVVVVLPDKVTSEGNHFPMQDEA